MSRNNYINSQLIEINPNKIKNGNVFKRIFKLNSGINRNYGKTFKTIKRRINDYIWKPLYEDIVTFCETASMQGLRYIVSQALHPIERIMWFVIVILLMYYGYNISMVQVHRYLTNPTVVSIRKNFREWTTVFPAVTICLSEKTDPELVRRFIEKKWNITEDNEKYAYVADFINLVAKTSFRTNLRLYWKYDKDPMFDNIDLMSIVSEVVPETLIRTSLHNREHKVVWETVMTEMGVCKTFNSIFSRFQSIETYKLQKEDKEKISLAKTEADLLKCHYLDKQCYARFNIANNTGQYYVHSPYEIAEAISNPMGLVEEGEELDSEFRASCILADEKIKTLNVDQRGCKYSDEHISRSIPAYSNALCQMECRSRLAEIFCGCRPFFYIIGDGKPCDTKGMSCISRNMEILINIPPDLAKCTCLPQCTEINYTPYFKKLSLWNASRITIFDVRATVKFAMKAPKVMMNKDLIFTFEDLIASVGGTSALFLGLSFISFFEIIFCLLKPLRRILYSLREHKKRKNTIIP